MHETEKAFLQSNLLFTYELRDMVARRQWELIN